MDFQSAFPPYGLCFAGGKSAILTAILVAFGIKAKGTQRANSIKDFVKNGCR